MNCRLALFFLLIATLPCPADARLADNWAKPVGMWSDSGESFVMPSTTHLDPMESVGVDDVDCAESWFDNLSFFGGIDGAKQPQDLGINANLGGRLSMNWGLPVWKEAGLGLQLGLGYVFSQNAVGVLERIDPSTNGREQLFATVGVFQRFEIFNWSLVHDVLSENYYDNFFLTQWRGRLGIPLGEKNEIGTWFALRGFDDEGLAGGVPVRLSTIDQLNFYWQHQWESGARTNVWLGIAGSHSEAIYVFNDNPRTDVMPVIGATINVPLNDWVALFGETNLIMPADSGTVDAYLGFAFYPGGGSRAAFTNRYAPVLPVAASPNFAVDVQR